MKKYNIIIWISILTTSFFAEAKVHVNAFKGISDAFYPETRDYSPALGFAAVESGLLSSLRFYNVVQAFDVDGSRDYGNDKPLNNDPIMSLLIKLFPSPAGQLASSSLHRLNFGNMVKKPETIAKLLNYAFYLENLKSNTIDRNAVIEDIVSGLVPHIDAQIATEQNAIDYQKALSIIENEITADALKDKSLTEIREYCLTVALSLPAIFKNLKSKFTLGFFRATKKEQLLSATKNISLKYIEQTYQKTVDEQLRPLRKVINEILQIMERYEEVDYEFYPRHFMQQLLLSFFCFHFNSKDEVKTLLTNLDNRIVNQFKAAQIDPNDLLEVSYVSQRMKAPEHNFDDALAIFYVDSFLKTPIPYRTGAILLANESAHAYLRLQDKIENRSFADCTEMAIRHIFNMLLYNKETKGWDFSHFKGQDNNLLFAELRSFYEKYNVDNSNNGNLDIRTNWNKVVGDLNVVGDSTNPITYVQGHYEIDTSLSNIIKVCSKLLNIPVNKSSPGKESEWVSNSLKQIFSTLNPLYDFKIEGDVKGNGELFGKIKVKAFEGADFSFSFDIVSSNRHLEVANLNTFQYQVSYPIQLQTKAGFAEETIWMLSDKLIKKTKLSHPFYSLLSTPINDENSKAHFLNSLVENVSVLGSENVFLKLTTTNFVGNLLKLIDFDTSHIVERITPSLLDLYNREHLRSVLVDNVKRFVFGYYYHDTRGFSIENWTKFTNLQSIKIYSNFRFDLFKNGLGTMANLKKLQFDRMPSFDTSLLPSSLEEIALSSDTGFSSSRNSLKIDLRPFKKLRKITLEHFSLANNPILDFSELHSLEEVELSCLHNIEHIRGLNDKISLKSLILSQTSLNKNSVIDLSGSVNLEVLDLGLKRDSGTAKGIASLSKLKKLMLWHIKDLPNLDFSEFSDIEKLGLHSCYPAIVVSGLNNLSKLSDLSLRPVNISRLDLSGSTKLKSLFLESDNLESISGIEQSSALYSLSISSRALSKLDISALRCLKHFFLDRVDELEEIEGLDQFLKRGVIASLKGISSHLAKSLAGKPRPLQITEDRMNKGPARLQPPPTPPSPPSPEQLLTERFMRNNNNEVKLAMYALIKGESITAAQQELIDKEFTSEEVETLVKALSKLSECNLL